MIQEKLRQDAKDFFHAGLQAVQPRAAVLKALRQRQPSLPETGGRIFLTAVGKAARGMLAGALEYLREREVRSSDVASRFFVVDSGNYARMDKCEGYIAGHPLPDVGSLRAGQRLMQLMRQAGAEDLVLMLISGGGSAMLACPVGNLTTHDEIDLTQLLLTSPLAIDESNLLRQQFSRIKGGGLARQAAPARMLTLLLSDVPGDDIRTIASGPTAALLGTTAEAMELARAKGIWERLPQGMREHLQAHKDDPAAPAPQNVEHVLVGSNGMMVSATAAAARAAGYETNVMDGWMSGDVGALAERLLGYARRRTHRHNCAADSSPMAFCCGGETVVEVSGSGKGGRNQELALRFALGAATQGDLSAPWVFLSAGSDGRDGPTDAAGGLVDGGSLERMKAGGVVARDLLANNDSYRALDASGDLLRISATGTNVADVQIFLN